jgi:hypothetical protein
MQNVANWQELTPEYKREDRFKKWLAAPRWEFDTSEAKKLYSKMDLLELW